MTAVAPVREAGGALLALDARIPQWWARFAACRGRTALFFPSFNERPEAKQRREDEARGLCRRCPVLAACREWARANGEYGFWGGESEEQRAAAGFAAEFPTGKVAQIIRERRASMAACAAEVVHSPTEIRQTGLATTAVRSS